MIRNRNRTAAEVLAGTVRTVVAIGFALMLIRVLLFLSACGPAPTAPEVPCQPDFSDTGKSRWQYDSTGAVILRVAWCGPITVDSVSQWSQVGR